MGLINFNAFVVVLSSSNLLVEKFHAEKYESLYSGALVIVAMFLRILNV